MSLHAKEGRQALAALWPRMFVVEELEITYSCFRWHVRHGDVFDACGVIYYFRRPATMLCWRIW